VSLVAKKKNSIFNLPNKLSIARIIMSFVIVIILVLPFDMIGLNLPRLFVGEQIVVDIKYLIAGTLFVLAAITDFLDGYIARKRNLITDFGKMIDAIADKILVNSVLIILAGTGFIHPIIPVIIVMRDTVVTSIRMVAASKGKVVAAIKSGKLKTICLMVGISLTMFYNLPFELYNIRVSDFFLFIAAILSLISCVQYYLANKDLIFED